MSYSCITSWRLDKGYSTADEQPPGDYILSNRNTTYSAVVISLILHK